MDSDKKTTLLGATEGILYMLGGIFLAFFNSPFGTSILEKLSNSQSTWAGILLIVIGIIRSIMGYYTNKK